MPPLIEYEKIVLSTEIDVTSISTKSNMANTGLGLWEFRECGDLKATADDRYKHNRSIRCRLVSRIAPAIVKESAKGIMPCGRS